MRIVLVVFALAGCGRSGFDSVDADMVDAPDPGIVQLSNRGTAACVRSGDGRVACWGANDLGQLGRGSTSTFGAPALVQVDNVVNIATGESTAFAIVRDGRLFGWGANIDGQLGLGRTSTAESTPQMVSIPPVVEVAAGQFHTCAITQQGGELYCWGDNDCGALGTGNQLGSTIPARVQGVSGVQSVTVNDRQTCFVDASGNPQCMGASSMNGGTCENLRLAPTPPAGLRPVISIAGGCHMSMCAVDETGAAWCWGDNVAGVLGDGTSMERLEPAALAVLSTNTRMIGTGYDASCAVTSSNTMFCWGANDNGQLGISTMSTNQENSPVPLPFFTGSIEIDQVETGCSTPCVRAGHDIYCWGANYASVVDDTTTDAFTPTLRTGLPF